jgi:hypothetical protein
LTQQILDAITKKAELDKGLDKLFDDDVTIAALKNNKKLIWLLDLCCRFSSHPYHRMSFPSIKEFNPVNQTSITPVDQSLIAASRLSCYTRAIQNS